MISKVSPITSSHHRCIDPLIEYLTHGHKDELKDEKERVSDFFTMNLYADDLETATQEMMYYASLNTRSSKSKYMHLILSLPENEKLDQATWKNIVSDYLDAVGMTGHQCIAVQHEDNGKQHYHLVINRIDVNTHARVNDYLLYKKLQRFDEQIEKKYNLNQFEHVKTFENKSERVARDIEKKSEHQSFISYLLLHKEEIINSKSWNELFNNLKKLNCTIAVKGRGLIIKSLSNKDYAIKASTFDRSFSYAKLIKKFGFYDFEKSHSNSSQDAQPEPAKTEYKQEPVTKNAKRIEYSQYFFKRILERHDDVVDKGNRLLVHKAKSYKTYQDILKIAKRRFGDGKIVATGSNDFQRRLMYHAIKMNIKVKFSDLKVQQEYERQLAKLKYKKAQIAKLHREQEAMKRQQEQMERLNEQTRRADELKQRARSKEAKRAAQEAQPRAFHR